MNPESGWEKGCVENKVGYLRRNELVPVPSFPGLAERTGLFWRPVTGDMEREHYDDNDRRFISELSVMTGRHSYHCRRYASIRMAIQAQGRINTAVLRLTEESTVIRPPLHSAKQGPDPAHIVIRHRHGCGHARNRHAQAAVWRRRAGKHGMAALPEIHSQEAPFALQQRDLWPDAGNDAEVHDGLREHWPRKDPQSPFRADRPHGIRQRCKDSRGSHPVSGGRPGKPQEPVPAPVQRRAFTAAAWHRHEPPSGKDCTF